MSADLNEFIADHDGSASLRMTAVQLDGKIALGFEQRSGRYDGEHFALIMTEPEFRSLVVDLNTFADEL